jgi:hypothetical protein
LQNFKYKLKYDSEKIEEEIDKEYNVEKAS